MHANRTCSIVCLIYIIFQPVLCLCTSQLQDAVEETGSRTFFWLTIFQDNFLILLLFRFSKSIAMYVSDALLSFARLTPFISINMIRTNHLTLLIDIMIYLTYIIWNLMREGLVHDFFKMEKVIWPATPHVHTSHAIMNFLFLYLQCEICMCNISVFEDPVDMPCGHEFCRACWEA